MNPIYDVILVGGGVGGIFAAYELLKCRPQLRVALLEQGQEIRQRSCPILDKKAASCISCPICAIMRGFGGAGAFSDGKFNFTTQFGGWLNEYLPDQQVMELIEYVDQINQKFGATSQFFSTESPEADLIRRQAIGYDLYLLNARCKHLGTDNNRDILSAQFKYLKERLDLYCGIQVINISPAGQTGYHLETSGGDFDCRRLIVAPGRSGAEWFSGQCRKLGLRLINNQVDIGVRVELPAIVFKSITDTVYEAKLHYRTKLYKDIVRTFCMNPYGYVVTENTEGIITVNGHSFSDPARRSENTNFALL
ncbi:MAG TPA: FAD-dependent oxidoreductase, partial [Clostridiales bacterium]|nr:FAD-dependent oxidoreductase [Clostridiales bacterium]